MEDGLDFRFAVGARLPRAAEAGLAVAEAVQAQTRVS